MKYKIEAFRNLNGQFYWHIKSKNRKILAHSEIYTRKEMCLKTANQLAKSLNCKVTFKDLSEDYEQ